MADKVIGDYSAAGSIDGSTHYLLIQPGNSSTMYNKISRNVLLGVSGQPADISSAQALTNKTIGNTNTITQTDTNFTIQDNVDNTKQIQFNATDISVATTRTFRFPNVSDIIVTESATQGLTNKTLTSPTINGGSIDSTTITVDSIAGKTSSTSGTIFGLPVTSSKVGTNGVITNSITASAVDYTKVANGFVVQVASSTFAAVATGTTTIPYDDTIPQSGEGTEFMTVAITPKSTSNILVIEAVGYYSNSAAVTTSQALFQDSTASALAANGIYQATVNGSIVIATSYMMTAGTTSSTTFKIRTGGSGAGTVTFNGESGARKYGAIAKSFIKVTEYKA